MRSPQKQSPVLCVQGSFTQEFQVQTQQCPHFHTSLVEAFVTLHKHPITSLLLKDFQKKQLSEINQWLEAPLPR